MSRKIVILLLTLAAASAAVTWALGHLDRPRKPPQPTQAARATVVLIHGLGRTPSSMNTLKQRLEAAGFHVINWDYLSTRARIEQHGERLRAFLGRLDRNPDVETIHIVGHSLGGIVARSALTREVPSKMGRVVMLAPPYKGSAAARKWAPLLGGLIKPLAQLSNDPKSAVNQLDVPAGVEFGVVAAASDGKVALEDTHLPGQADHIVVPGYHTFIMNRPDVADHIIHFLHHARFNRPPDPQMPSPPRTAHFLTGAPKDVWPRSQDLGERFWNADKCGTGSATSVAPVSQPVRRLAWSGPPGTGQARPPDSIALRCKRV